MAALFSSPVHYSSPRSACICPFLSLVRPSTAAKLAGNHLARPSTLAFSSIHFPQALVSGKAYRPGSVRALSSATGDGSTATVIFTNIKHVLLPILDRNPYLSEATRQATVVTTNLAKRYSADITVVVIDEDTKENISNHDLRMQNIRWHLAEGGCDEFKLIEKLGEGKKPAAVIGEVADDMGLDLVVLSMESIHSKHIDGNLLAEFLPCPVLLLPL